MAVPAPASRRRLAAPALFGGFDGMASLIGVVVFLAASRPQVIFPAALCGALSSAVSMGAGEFLSDSASGWKSSGMMGLGTLCGALAPAVPFAFGHGPLEVAECAVTCAAVAVIVAALRPGRPLGIALAETAGLLAAAVAVALACAWLIPGGAA